jgi:hypothetical protein
MDRNYVKFGNCVGFVAGQIGGDGQESKGGVRSNREDRLLFVALMCAVLFALGFLIIKIIF